MKTASCIYHLVVAIAAAFGCWFAYKTGGLDGYERGVHDAAITSDQRVLLLPVDLWSIDNRLATEPDEWRVFFSHKTGRYSSDHYAFSTTNPELFVPGKRHWLAIFGEKPK
jgi:hypothetical protein